MPTEEDDLFRLQKESRAWVMHNFEPTEEDFYRRYYRPLLGIFEEIDEMFTAASKADVLELQDAVADIVIFLADYCNRVGLYLPDLWKNRSKVDSLDDALYLSWLQLIGKLAHHNLKRDQGIRGAQLEHEEKIKEALHAMLGRLDYLARQEHFCVVGVTVRVWDTKVSKRNWKRNTTDGGAP